jgi:hypothetical protein
MFLAVAMGNDDLDRWGRRRRRRKERSRAEDPSACDDSDCRRGFPVSLRRLS